MQAVFICGQGNAGVTSGPDSRPQMRVCAAGE